MRGGFRADSEIQRACCTVYLSRCRIEGYRCFDLRIEYAQTSFNATVRDRGKPSPAAWANALVLALCSGSLPVVNRVAIRVSNSQVLPLIVQCVEINVVNDFSGFRAHNDSMKPQAPALAASGKGRRDVNFFAFTSNRRSPCSIADTAVPYVAILKFS